MSGRTAIYLTHPEVVIDPAVPVPDWGLSDIGAARVAALTARLGPMPGVQVVSSGERKALETAWPLAAGTGRAVMVRPHMHENDRSATGFLPGAEFETVADAFFANPDESVRGWETARAAQTRIVAEARAVLASVPDGPLIFTGHGGVGTLLFCHLAGHPIDRKWDQPGGGHWFRFDTATGRPEAGWAPVETLTGL